MKLNYTIGIISFIILIITLLLSIYLNFFISKNDISDYCYGITINILASSFFGLITTIVYYNYEKTKTIKKILKFCSKIIRNFSEIEYVENIEYCSYEQYKKINNNDEFNKLSNYKKKREYDISKQLYEEYIYNKINNQIKKYLEFLNFDLSEFWELEKEIDTINNKSKTYKILRRIFDDTLKIHNEILDCKFHFEEYLKAENGSIKFNYNLLLQLQSNFFTIIDEYSYRKGRIHNITEELIYSYHYDYNNNIYFYTSNQVIKKYNDYFNQLIKKKKISKS